MIDGPNKRLDENRLVEAVEGFARVRILVLGDIMLDRFIWGSVGRISPEAPVPVVEVKSETTMLGGAANVLHNLIALGGGASICGLVGDDGPGDQVAGLLTDLDVDPKGLVRCENRQTTVKTRVVAHSQQVVRVDREDRRQAEAGDFDRVRNYLLGEMPRCDAVIVSDYAKGVITRPLIKALLGATRERGKTVAVDPKVGNMPLYKGCTIITPNHFEAAAAGAGFVGRDVTAQVLSLRDLIRQAIAHPGFSFVEVLSDCTEIYGRKNDLGASPEMMLAKKSAMRPFAYRNTVDVPFRPNHLKTGVIARNERAEYGAAYRAMAARQRGEEEAE